MYLPDFVHDRQYPRLVTESLLDVHNCRVRSASESGAGVENGTDRMNDELDVLIIPQRHVIDRRVKIYAY